jgi:hypothetical protein
MSELEDFSMGINKRNAAYIELEAAGRLFIEEQRGGGYQIHMADQIHEDIWIGVPVEHGMHFFYWKDAMKFLAGMLTKNENASEEELINE